MRSSGVGGDVWVFWARRLGLRIRGFWRLGALGLRFVWDLA